MDNKGFVGKIYCINVLCLLRAESGLLADKMAVGTVSYVVDMHLRGRSVCVCLIFRKSRVADCR